MELHDGDRDHLCATADRDLLLIPQPHEGRPDDGRGQGLSLTTESGRAEEVGMRSTPQVLAAGPVVLNRPRRPSWHRHLHGSECAWAIAFIIPYATVFVAFVVYPSEYGPWMASGPSRYGDLARNPRYPQTVSNR